jgi:hypothetical protein
MPQYSPEILAAFESVQFIAQHIKDADKETEVRLHPQPHHMLESCKLQLSLSFSAVAGV